MSLGAEIGFKNTHRDNVARNPITRNQIGLQYPTQKFAVSEWATRRNDPSLAGISWGHGHGTGFAPVRCRMTARTQNGGAHRAPLSVAAPDVLGKYIIAQIRGLSGYLPSGRRRGEPSIWCLARCPRRPRNPSGCGHSTRHLHLKPTIK